MKWFLSLVLSVFVLNGFVQAQTAEVTVSLNEKFFETLLDALLAGSNAPEFPLAVQAPPPQPGIKNRGLIAGFAATKRNDGRQPDNRCRETLRLQREMDGVRTAVQFRDGQIFTPLAFTGSYNPPLVGCVNFAGVAETRIDLEFDRSRQVLIGRAQILNVNLSGTGGVGGSVLARLVQSSIDSKVNPIEILPLDKLSFIVPVQNSGNLQMKAVGIRQTIAGSAINIHVTYQFEKM